MDLVITKEVHEKYCVLYIQGRFWARTLKLAEDSIRDALKEGRPHMLIDMKKTTLIDSSAIGILVTLHKNLEPRGGGVSLCSISPKVSTALNTANLGRVLKMYKSPEEAGKKIGSPIEVEERGLYFLIRLKTDLKLITVASIREVVEEAFGIGHKNIAFDLRQANTIDSVGIGVLINLYKKVKVKRGGVYLIAVQPTVQAALEAVKVSSLLKQFESVEEADNKIF